MYYSHILYPHNQVEDWRVARRQEETMPIQQTDSTARGLQIYTKNVTHGIGTQYFSCSIPLPSHKN